MAEPLKQRSDGRFVFLCFAAFFGLIVAVNSVFIYSALTTHSGVVTDDPYEKGLAYNTLLEQAKTQPAIEHKVSYSDGVLRWRLAGVTDASVSASLIRPVQDGYDFDIKLDNMGGGIYEARPSMPLPGTWTAKLKATWNSNQLQISHDFIVK